MIFSLSIRSALRRSLTPICLLAAGGFQTVLAQTNDAPPIDELTVTALKREQPLQELPLAATVWDADMIRISGIQTIQQLTDLHPSVSFDQAQSFQNSSLKIRGIGTIGVSRTFEGAVGTFFDGIYRSRSGMAIVDLLDIQALEILRGPQSTMFGKNTSAGAIALRSNRPLTGAADDPWSGYGEARFGNFDSTYLNGALNIPVTEIAGLRLAGSYNKRDAFMVSPDTGDQYDEVDRYALKGQFLLEPTDNFSLWIIGDYSKSDAKCCWASVVTDNGPTTPLIQAYSQLNGKSFVLAPDQEKNRNPSFNTAAGETIEDSGLTMTIDWNINDRFLFRSLTGTRSWEQNSIDADADFTGTSIFVLNEPADIKTFSQEFNLLLDIGNQGQTGYTDLLIGLYYANEDYKGTRLVETGSDSDNYLNALISSDLGATACLPPFIEVDCAFPSGIGALLPDGEWSREFFSQDSDSYAIFGHAITTLKPDYFDLFLGLRYSIEEKDGAVDNVFWYDSAIVRAVLASQGIPDDGTPRNGFDLIGTLYSPSFNASTRDEEVTGTVALNYYATRDRNIMAYGLYSRGYKAGGPNLYREAVVAENTTYDPEFADNFELGLKTQYLDYRATTNVTLFYTKFTDLQINFFDGLNFRTENTGEASTRGIELENWFDVIRDELKLNFAVTYMKAQFDKVTNPFLSYLVGRDTPRAPRWASVLELVWERPITDSLSLLARGLGSYSGDQYVGADIPDEPKVNGYIIADAYVGLGFKDTWSNNWELLAWCTNCTDETYRTIYFNSVFQPGSYSAYLNNSRMYGVTLRTRF